MSQHYHVVEFVQGCLNDYDSGPIRTLTEARRELRTLRNDWHVSGGREQRYVPAGTDRYERGVHVLKIETCTEACEKEQS